MWGTSGLNCTLPFMITLLNSRFDQSAIYWQGFYIPSKHLKMVIKHVDHSSLLVATKFHPTPIMLALLEHVAPSRPVVVFSQFKEVQKLEQLKLLTCTAYRSILALRTAYHHFLASRTAYCLTTKNNHFGRFHLHKEVTITECCTCMHMYSHSWKH